MYTRFDRIATSAGQNDGAGAAGSAGTATGDTGSSDGSSRDTMRSSGSSVDNDPAAAPWRLTMGIVGDAVPPSVVIADRPYMGLVPTAQSWGTAAFSTAYPGSCWELYVRVHRRAGAVRMLLVLRIYDSCAWLSSDRPRAKKKGLC